jgi:hypothetical protein
MPRGWIEDELPADDAPAIERGEAWVSNGGDDMYPTYRHPIGYMRRKPVVRVKAWTVPIRPDGDT